MNANQAHLFGAAEGADQPARPSGEAVSPVVASEAESFELARAHFNLPAPPEAEPAFLKEERRLKAEATGAGRLGLVAKWANYELAKGHVSIFDPVEGEWHDVPWKDAPSWAKWEAPKRAALYKAGDRRAYDLTSLQMHDLWEREHPPEEEGIVEDYGIEGESQDERYQ